MPASTCSCTARVSANRSRNRLLRPLILACIGRLDALLESMTGKGAQVLGRELRQANQLMAFGVMRIPFQKEAHCRMLAQLVPNLRPLRLQVAFGSWKAHQPPHGVEILAKLCLRQGLQP